MGIFDRFRGKKQEQEHESPLNDSVAAGAVSSTLDLTEQPGPHADAAKILGISQEEAGRLYNPYEGKLYTIRIAKVIRLYTRGQQRTAVAPV